ncbi:TVP38/TMEM64 family protein [Brevibacillus gelatini]|uniref:TVP38/TMEM64 family protein n=1 Tax=Brevibacillus gelatini TaxID=1655277 RepID=UPI003D814BF3
MKKWVLLFGYAFVFLIGFWQKEMFLDWIESDSIQLLPLMFLASVILGLFPVIPFGLFAGMMGAKFGPIWGAFINWTGSVGSAWLFFLFVRYGYQQTGRHYLAKYPRLALLTRAFEQNAFVAILFARLIPFIPSPVINIYAAISAVRFPTFALATAIGKIPTMLVFALLGDQLFHNAQRFLLTILAYAGFLGIAILLYRIWQSRSKAKTPS